MLCKFAIGEKHLRKWQKLKVKVNKVFFIYTPIVYTKSRQIFCAALRWHFEFSILLWLAAVEILNSSILQQFFSFLFTQCGIELQRVSCKPREI